MAAAFQENAIAFLTQKIPFQYPRDPLLTSKTVGIQIVNFCFLKALFILIRLQGVWLSIPRLINPSQ